MAYYSNTIVYTATNIKYSFSVVLKNHVYIITIYICLLHRQQSSIILDNSIFRRFTQ